MISYRVVVKAARMRDGDGDGKCRETRDGRWVPCPPGTPVGTILDAKPGKLRTWGERRSETTRPVTPKPPKPTRRTGKPTRTTAVAPSRPADDKIDWKKAAPDGIVYRAQQSGRDYTGRRDNAVVYFTGDRRMAADYGDELFATALPDDALDLRRAGDRKRLLDATRDVFDELEIAANELDGERRRKWLTARRDLNDAIADLENTDDATAASRVMAALSLAVNAAEDPINPLRSGTGQRKVLDRLRLPAIIETDTDGKLSIAYRFPPKMVAAPVNKRPSRPMKPSPPPLSGAAQDLADEAGGDWGRFAELLDQRGYVVFDYETTGFDAPNTNRPVQIGAVRIKDGQVVDRFNVFVNPGEALGDWSKANLKDADGNLLTDEYLADQPDMAAAHRQLVDFLGDDIIVAHNLPFDQGVLDKMLKESGIDYEAPGAIDSLELARQIVPKSPAGDDSGPNGHSLANLTEFFGVDNSAWHTADGDAKNTAEVLAQSLAFAKGRFISPEPMDPEWQRNRIEEGMRKYALDNETYKLDEAAWKAEVARVLDATKPSTSEDAPRANDVTPEAPQATPPDVTPEQVNDLDQVIAERRAAAAKRAATIAERAKSFRTKEQEEEAARWFHDDNVPSGYGDWLENWIGTNPEPDADDYVTRQAYDIALGKWRARSIAEHSDERDTIIADAYQKISKIFGGTFVGKDGETYSVRIENDVDTAWDDDEALVFNGTIRDAAGRRVGEFTRKLIPGDDSYVYHEIFTIEPNVQDRGIASAFNARNEGFYTLMGYESIKTEGASGMGGFIGATHWPRNGFDWDDERNQQKFLNVIEDAIDNFDRQAARNPDEEPYVFGARLFSSKTERDAVAEMVAIAKKQSFGDSDRLVPADLLHWSGAEEWFQAEEISINYRRQL